MKLLAAVLWTHGPALDEAAGQMQRIWGPIDYTSGDFPFDVTRYYEEEMGPDLKRRFYSFSRLRAPEEFVAIKHEAAAIEQRLSVQSRRLVNIDPGYLDPHKLVLVSFKYGAQKVYLGKGVWADPICLYRKGTFEGFRWTFADFKDGRYTAVLLQIRSRYREGLRREQ